MRIETFTVVDDDTAQGLCRLVFLDVQIVSHGKLDPKRHRLITAWSLIDDKRVNTAYLLNYRPIGLTLGYFPMMEGVLK